MSKYKSKKVVYDGMAGAALPNVNDNGDKIDGYGYAYKTDSNGEPYIHIDSVRDMLKKAEDVQSVKRGFWKALMMSEETGWDLSLTCGHDAVCEYVCSVCGKPAIIDEFGAVFLPDYCPNCGARMDGGTENG